MLVPFDSRSQQNFEHRPRSVAQPRRLSRQPGGTRATSKESAAARPPGWRLEPNPPGQNRETRAHHGQDSKNLKSRNLSSCRGAGATADGRANHWCWLELQYRAN